MNKLGHTQVAEILRTGSGALRFLSQENKNLREKVAAFELAERCRGIAKKMSEKGIYPGLSEEEKVAQLTGQTSRLDAIEEAVNMSADQSVLPASLAEAEQRIGNGTAVGVGEQLLITHLLSD